MDPISANFLQSFTKSLEVAGSAFCDGDPDIFNFVFFSQPANFLGYVFIYIAVTIVWQRWVSHILLIFQHHQFATIIFELLLSRFEGILNKLVIEDISIFKMNILKAMYKFFNRQEIDSTNNAIEFIWDTQYHCNIVRAVDEKKNRFFLFNWFFICTFVSTFSVYGQFIQFSNNLVKSKPYRCLDLGHRGHG